MGFNLLSWFPRPYEDELLYSIFARFFNQSIHVSVRDTLGNLFKDQRAKVTPDFPSNLEVLANQIQLFDYKSIDLLITQHTPFHYFTNFLEPSHKKQVINEIKKPKLKNVQMLLGQMASNVKETKYFKYCPTCFEEDLKQNGESYWRISHQLPSVLVCLKHNSLLHFSSVKYRNNNSELFSPNDKNCLPSPLNQCISDNLTNDEIYHLKKIGIESKKLLNFELGIDPSILQLVYKGLLRKNGFITTSGNVRQEDLHRSFMSFYGKKVLEYFQCNLKLEQESCWLKTITRKHRISFHPVRHLLLLNFLGQELDEISLPSSNGPFGKGPFPCLNPTAKHFKEKLITDVKIKRCSDTGKPIGTFTCSCEFQYTRLGPDLNEEDKYTYRFVRCFGEVWCKKLIEYIDKEKLSYRKTAQYLSVDVGTVIKYYNLQKKVNNEEKLIKKPSEVIDYRAIWKANLKLYPEYTKTELRQLNPKVYTWLYKNDKEFLNNNSPDFKKRKHINNRVDWNKRDLNILEQIRHYLLSIDENERPIRITKRHIAVAIDKLGLIEKKLDKLPLTKEFILLAAESNTQYKERLRAWNIEKSF